MNKLVLALELQHRRPSHTIAEQSLIGSSRGCGESEHLLALELPQTLDALLLDRVRSVGGNHVVLVQDHDLTPGSLSVEHVDRGDRDPIVNYCELLGHLYTQVLIWLHDCHTQALLT